MAFYAGRIIREPAMANPTIVVLTDRNDLDDQLFGTFSRCQDLLRQPPAQAETRADLRAKLSVDADGVVFTTIQKFLPEAPSPQPSPASERGSRMEVLSPRRNIIVIADEAHRSQYDFIDRYGRLILDGLRDEPGGLVVDYLGLAHELKAALATYAESGGTGKTAIDQQEAVAVMLEKYEICGGLFHGFSWSKWSTGTQAERLGLLPPAQEHILAQQDGKDRLLRAVQELSQAFALAVPHDEALRIRDDVAFFQAVRAILAKRAPGEARTEEEIAVKVLGDETLRAIARELVATVRANVTIDWTVRENVRAQLRVLVKRILRKHGYPPDKQEKATQTVLEQAEVLSDSWVNQAA